MIFRARSIRERRALQRVKVRTAGALCDMNYSRFGFEYAAADVATI